MTEILWEIAPGALQSIERSLGMPNVECPVCEGEGWACEDHPDVGWRDGGGCSCGGAGAPCRCRPSEWRKS